MPVNSNCGTIRFSEHSIYKSAYRRSYTFIWFTFYTVYIIPYTFYRDLSADVDYGRFSGPLSASYLAHIFGL